MKFNEKLREQRKGLNLTQREAAEKLGVSVTCYSGYEQGYREPDFKTLVKICKTFGISADYLLGLTD